MRWTSLFLFATLVGGCSLLTQFDPNTQPCDAAGACLPGYSCQSGICVFTDGGAGGGGGGTGCSPACGSNETCLRNQCFSLSCGATACATGAVCVANSCTKASCAGLQCDTATQICVDGVCQAKQCGTTVCVQSQACQGGRCVDVSCTGLTCSTNQRCVGGACVQCAATEATCSNNLDDDCDGTIDCADTDCNGRICDDGDPCTETEACATMMCRGGQPKACNTPGSCESGPGSCQAGTGLCVYPPQTDGTLCGANTAERCCSGQCVSLTLQQMNCGGCGLTCQVGQSCEPINAPASGCGTGPTGTSGRCTCTSSTQCPGGQTCAVAQGICVPTSATNCAPMQQTGTVLNCGAYCRY